MLVPQNIRQDFSGSKYFTESWFLGHQYINILPVHFQHTPMDAMTLVVCTYYVDLYVRKYKGKWQV